MATSNGNDPATKADLQALEQRLEEKMGAVEQRFEGKLDATEQRLRDHVGEVVRDSETRLLQAFYSYAEANNKRVGQLEMNDLGVVTRLGTLENRVLDIEKRLNIPPQ
jgi:hypothetical protein